ncbi:MAG TPA: hypothetical protein DCZ30_05655 [Clostridiales bacterium]|nr:hypothetical protein [Clostridiales bacterium]
MEENNQNQNQSINAEEIKKEAKETVNQVKDSFKNVDVKQETEKAKNFFSGIISTPIKKISEIAHDKSNNFFKTAIVLLVLWVLIAGFQQVASIIGTIFKFGFKYISFSDFLGIAKAVITPLLEIVILSGIVYLFQKQNKKSFLTVVNTIVASYFPIVVAKVVGLLNLISGASRITSPITGLLGVISLVFTFFAIKELSDEKDNDKAVKQFVIIEAVYYVVAFILSFLKLYI